MNKNQLGENARGNRFYHGTTKLHDGATPLTEPEKRRYIDYMRRYGIYCQVRVLNFCLLPDQVQVLLEVPSRPAVLPHVYYVVDWLLEVPGREEEGLYLLQAYAAIPGGSDAPARREMMEAYFQQMWDPLQYLTMLQKRFSLWANRGRRRRGNFWQDRFECRELAGADAAWGMLEELDQLPVRAGLVPAAELYPWSGLGEPKPANTRAAVAQRLMDLTCHQ